MSWRPPHFFKTQVKINPRTELPIQFILFPQVFLFVSCYYYFFFPQKVISVRLLRILLVNQNMCCLFLGLRHPRNRMYRSGNMGVEYKESVEYYCSLFCVFSTKKQQVNCPLTIWTIRLKWLICRIIKLINGVTLKSNRGLRKGEAFYFANRFQNCKCNSWKTNNASYVRVVKSSRAHHLLFQLEKLIMRPNDSSRNIIIIFSTGM